MLSILFLKLLEISQLLHINNMVRILQTQCFKLFSTLQYFLFLRYGLICYLDMKNSDRFSHLLQEHDSRVSL